MASTRAGKKKRIWPMPEVLSGEVYTVRESPRYGARVCTDLNSRLMFVPSSDTPEGRMSRLHEMGHVAITPKDGHVQAEEAGIGSDYINVAEDMRLNGYLERNFSLERSISDALLENMAKGYELRDDFKTATLMAVADTNMPDQREYLDNFSGIWQYRIQKILEMCRYLMYEKHSQTPGFNAALDVAQYLQAVFESGILDALGQPGVSDGVLQSWSPYQDDLDWGKMTIVKPVLKVSLPQRRLVRRITPKEYGDRIMFPSRLDEDDKIFGNIRRVPRGTVLVDASGSMMLDADDIAEIVKVVPGATVACYSGEHDTGHLTIVAEKGQMVKEDELNFPGANVVDGPALEWLGSQHKPRVWMSDGQVTGIGDTVSMKLTAQARRTVVQNNITQVPDVAGVLKALKTK